MNLFEDNGAHFSPCRNYRYALWRIWDKRLPLVIFIGLNPSKANESRPDPTITRVTGFANAWGFGCFYMMNLFAWVTSKPKEHRKCADPLGDNDGWIENIAGQCGEIIFAWGAFKGAQERATTVIERFPEGKALIINNDGTPRHPLYVKGDCVPVLYKHIR